MISNIYIIYIHIYIYIYIYIYISYHFLCWREYCIAMTERQVFSTCTRCRVPNVLDLKKNNYYGVNRMS